MRLARPMFPFASLASLATVASLVTLAVTASAQSAPAAAATPSAPWSVRFDQATANAAALDVRMERGEMRVTSGPAAIFWSPASVTSGPFVLEATFSQLKRPAHPEAYGLFWGGKDLKAATQEYYYLIVRGDGKYMVKHRAGAETHELVPWTDHAALVKEDASGMAKNLLRVEAGAGGVRLMANGQLLRELPPGATDDGLAGIRVNHSLDVSVGGFSVKP